MSQRANEPPQRARVLFIDRDHMIRAAVARMLDQTHDLCCIETLPTSDDLITHVERIKADVVVIRLRPNLAGDLDAIRALTDAPAAVPVLACPDSPDAQALRDALAAGASAVITTDDDPSTVLEAIREALTGRPFIAPRAADLLAPRAG